MTRGRCSSVHAHVRTLRADGCTCPLGLVQQHRLVNDNRAPKYALVPEKLDFVVHRHVHEGSVRGVGDVTVLFGQFSQCGKTVTHNANQFQSNSL